MYAYSLFPTSLGSCAIAWGPRGVVAVELPDADEARTLRRLRRALPGVTEAAPPAQVEAAIAAIGRLLDGEPDDLRSVELDMGDLPEFHRRVYAATRAIPPGATRSYGEVAAEIGEAGAAQAVGQALGRNPFPIVVPCHRVLAADGRLHGFSAPGGLDTKRRMLAIEGATPPTLFD